MTRIPYPQWPKGCLYEHAPYFRLHWPNIQGKQWSLPPALNVEAQLTALTGPLEGTWHFGTRIQFGAGDWWRYYLTTWDEVATFDRLWLTFYCIQADDHIIMRVSGRLVDEDEIHIGVGHTDYVYLGENTKTRIPWTETTNVRLYDWFNQTVGNLTISPVWPDNRWPKIPEKQL